MSGIKDYSTTPANNTALFPEGMAPSAVNDGMRQVQADLRDWYNDAQWVVYGDGDGAFTIAYVSPTSFSVNGVNVTGVYHAGRRVKADGTLTGTIFGTITGATFATNTTVTVAWDSGALQNESLTIAIGILSSTNGAMPTASATAPGAVQLASSAETGEGSATSKAVTPAGLSAAEMVWTAPHTFRSTDSGAGEAVAIDLDRASATPAANDLLMALRWKMRDAAGGTDVAAKLVAKLLDATAGNEDAELQFATLVAGTLAPRLMVGQGLYTPSATGGDKGGDSGNFGSLFINGTRVVLSDVVVSGTTASPALSDHGKMYIPTGAGFALTLPVLSGLFNGYRVGLQNQCSSGTCLANRSGTDTVVSQGTTGLTSITLPIVGDQVWFIADVTNSRWLINGKRSFESAEITPTAGLVSDQAHSLGVVPKHTSLIARCKTAELGFSVGDEVHIPHIPIQNANTDGHMLVADSTNLSLRIGTGGDTPDFRVVNKTSPAAGVVTTTANWKRVVRAWVVN